MPFRLDRKVRSRARIRAGVQVRAPGRLGAWVVRARARVIAGVLTRVHTLHAHARARYLRILG